MGKTRSKKRFSTISEKAPVFPSDFLWGAATSAYQIEGSPLADGAGASIWHRFSHTPGRVARGETGDVACDHYRRFRDDITLMRELGLKAYRFSISWSRVLPQGRGAVNPAGLGFYDRLVDALLKQGIVPVPTLFHWDLPAALEDRGGWLNPDIAEWFAEYAALLFRALDGRVEMWSTLNEPWVVSDGGYLHGKLAPGHRDLFEAPIAAHNLLRGHARAVEAYRAEGRHRIGLVVNLEPKYSASDSPADRAAVRRSDAYMNRQFLDPVFFGRYPEELAEIFGEAWPRWRSSEVEQIRQPIDFLGVNYYTRAVIAQDAACFPLQIGWVLQRQSARTQMGWEVYPPGLTDVLLEVKQRYGDVPLYVTENGAAFYDPPSSESLVDDPLRVRYLQDHIRAAQRARARGVDLKGYFVWSLLDNYEWAHGYSKRFGIVHVDFQTQKRTIKASGRFYAEVIRTQGTVLAGSSKERKQRG